MSEAFPPKTTHQREVTMLVEAISSTVEGKAAIYVSSPLTTGPRAFEWHRRHSMSGSHATNGNFDRDVVEPNRDEAARFVRALRERVGKVVIDPTAMGDVEGWAQSDYRYFWGLVIDTYCDEVIFRDGWQYSSGCTFEYLVALGAGARVLTEGLDPLAEDEARAAIDDAILETERHGAVADFLRSVSTALRAREGLVWRE